MQYTFTATFCYYAFVGYAWNGQRTSGKLMARMTFVQRLYKMNTFMKSYFDWQHNLVFIEISNKSEKAIKFDSKILQWWRLLSVHTNYTGNTLIPKMNTSALVRSHDYFKFFFRLNRFYFTGELMIPADWLIQWIHGYEFDYYYESQTYAVFSWIGGYCYFSGCKIWQSNGLDLLIQKTSMCLNVLNVKRKCERPIGPMELL